MPPPPSSTPRLPYPALASAPALSSLAPAPALASTQPQIPDPDPAGWSTEAKLALAALVVSVLLAAVPLVAPCVVPVRWRVWGLYEDELSDGNYHNYDNNDCVADLEAAKYHTDADSSNGDVVALRILRASSHVEVVEWTARSSAVRSGKSVSGGGVQRRGRAERDPSDPSSSSSTTDLEACDLSDDATDHAPETIALHVLLLEYESPLEASRTETFEWGALSALRARRPREVLACG
ncbi:uncharacterized protein K452DRAFT_296139 [Aplosporella prunicola CBS 121167]|uniref:Uncharacterized protein n=1 Tax=Aplosporella prunicola CBS 121167 TaxID=1176127 RepID=A0A6A6BNC8_9PEZI|nr:uncharacterized protein K452DRAFT_296139 [Aplosporella prunicola CBS 121167]KAF2144744.1 hypothetical protein K452DRAFT_296139 [Aplosporella prunicola CBS 121167]